MISPSLIRSRRQAFTLVEVMVVVAIIVILMSLVIGGVGYIETKRREEGAKVTIGRLNMALEQYKTNTGLIPEDAKNPTLSSNQLYRVLFGDADNDGKTDEGAVVYYDDLDPNISKGQKGNRLVEKRNNVYVILDPWGQPYRYRRGFNEGNTNARNPDFDIWSIGKDGRNNTKDDISNASGE